MKKLLLVLLCLGLVGCAAPTLKNVKKDYFIDINSGKSLVFGKLDFKGTRNKLISLWLKDMNTDVKYRIAVECKKDRLFQDFQPTYFFVELEEGDYKFFQIVTFVSETKTADIDIPFSVNPNKVIYLGTFKIEAETKVRFPLIPYYSVISQQIVDERGEAIVKLKQQYPNITGDVVIDLPAVGEIGSKDYWSTFRSKKAN